jgi:ABC-2 type transport system ATP-binding protein
MAAVEIAQVTKTFGDTVAVKNLSLSIPEGSIYGFIGPNGSGKSTTMRMIVNIYYPDQGSIRVFGKERAGVGEEHIGYLPEERGLYRNMKIGELLAFYAELRGGRNTMTEIDQWLKRFDLEKWKDHKLDALSKGMSQKIQFIATVVPAPRLLILDEPFTGLDPVSSEVIRAAVLDLRKSGTTVILSTHDMNVASELCDSIFMIYKGNKVLDGKLADIQKEYGRDTIEVATSGGAVVLENLPGIERVKDLGQTQELRMARDCDSQEVLRVLMTRTSVLSFSISPPSLRDIFVRIAGPQAEVHDDAA